MSIPGCCVWHPLETQYNIYISRFMFDLTHPSMGNCNWWLNQNIYFLKIHFSFFHSQCGLIINKKNKMFQRKVFHKYLVNHGRLWQLHSLKGDLKAAKNWSPVIVLAKLVTPINQAERGYDSFSMFRLWCYLRSPSLSITHTQKKFCTLTITFLTVAEWHQTLFCRCSWESWGWGTSAEDW